MRVFVCTGSDLGEDCKWTLAYVCEEEQRLFFSEKELQRDYYCIGNKCRSQFGKELTGTTFEGGVLNISPLQYSYRNHSVNA